MIEAERERRIRGGLTFFGRITASISHEFNNVITIIGEVSGLLEDLCHLAEQGRPIAPEKLRRQCDLISKQIKRAKQIIREMNHFAHSVDEPIEHFDVEDELRATASLSERLAALKGFHFELPDGGSTLQVAGQRFLFHELIFVLLSSIFEGGAEGGVIELRIGHNGGSALVIVSGDVPESGGPNQNRLEYASLLAKELGGELDTDSTEKNRVVHTISLTAL